HGYDALESGRYEKAENHNPQVLSFYRVKDKKRILIFINLSDAGQTTSISGKISKAKNLFGSKAQVSKNVISVTLPPYGISVSAM
ncbi:MAG: hypothetical protein EOP06_23120, partial [Proteobacteria bacterium]